jgi:aquaporin Z
MKRAFSRRLSAAFHPSFPGALARAALAELCGTTGLVALVTTAYALSARGWMGTDALPLVVGASTAAFSFAFGHASGAHFSPGLSLTHALRGNLALVALPVYVAAQIAGSFAGAALTVAVLGRGPLGQRFPSGPLAGHHLAAFWVEAALSAVVFATAGGISVPFPVAIAAGLVALVGAPMGLGVANPARALGPSLLEGDTPARGALWIFATAPLLGALIAATIVSLTTVGAGAPHPPTTAEEVLERDMAKIFAPPAPVRGAKPYYAAAAGGYGVPSDANAALLGARGRGGGAREWFGEGGGTGGEVGGAGSAGAAARSARAAQAAGEAPEWA